MNKDELEKLNKEQLIVEYLEEKRKHEEVVSSKEALIKTYETKNEQLRKSNNELYEKVAVNLSDTKPVKEEVKKVTKKSGDISINDLVNKMIKKN